MSSELLKKVQVWAKTQTEDEPQEDLTVLSLSQLGSRKIRFGKVKQGMTIAEAITDTEWTTFMVSRYETSLKAEHQEVIVYIARIMGTAIQSERKPTKKTALQHCIAAAWELQHPVEKIPQMACSSKEHGNFKKMTMAGKMMIPEDDSWDEAETVPMDATDRIRALETSMTEVVNHMRELGNAVASMSEHVRTEKAVGQEFHE
jgi:hypothetical protein